MLYTLCDVMGERRQSINFAKETHEFKKIYSSTNADSCGIFYVQGQKYNVLSWFLSSFDGMGGGTGYLAPILFQTGRQWECCESILDPRNIV